MSLVRDAVITTVAQIKLQFDLQKKIWSTFLSSFSWCVNKSRTKIQATLKHIPRCLLRLEYTFIICFCLFSEERMHCPVPKDAWINALCSITKGHIAIALSTQHIVLLPFTGCDQTDILNVLLCVRACERGISFTFWDKVHLRISSAIKVICLPCF